MVGMLPRSRVVAVLTLGLGCVLLAVGLALPALVPPERPVPLDLASTQLTVKDDEAVIGGPYVAQLQDGPEGTEGTEGTATVPVTITYAVQLGEPAGTDYASATVGVTLVRDDIDGDDSLLDAEVWSYRIDRLTGAPLGDAKVADTPGTPPVATDVSGQWLAFPRDTSQQEYSVFDDLLRRSLPAQFVQTEEIDGAEVYVFRQDFRAEPVLQDNPGYVRGTSTTEDGEPSSLYRNGFKEYRVEPSSGMIVSVTEDIQDVYVPDGSDAAGGDRSVELLSSFSGSTPQDERDELLAQAAELGEDRATRGWGIALTATGAIVALGSAIVALRPQRPQRAQRSGPAS